jgi:hypothetical protein
MPAADAKQGDGGGGTTLAQYRETVKRQVVSIRWEMGMLIFVLFYFVVVFLTFAFEDQKIARLLCGGWITQTCKTSTIDVIDSIFYVIDLAFLTLFLLEIMLKLFGLGFAYLQDWFNGIDFLIILISLVMTVREHAQSPAVLSARARPTLSR